MLCCQPRCENRADYTLGVAVGVGRWMVKGPLGDDGADGVVITAYFLVGASP
jgi:hypothetical protein